MIKRTATIAIGLLALSQAASAQIGISIRGSTLGAGGEISYRANRYLDIRAGGNYLRFTRNATIDGIEYDITPKLQNGSAILDLHPFGSALHLSGGLVWNSNEGNVTARLTGPITIGTNTYQPADIGSLTGRLSYDTKYAPYAGIGFSGRGRVSLLFDLGVVFSGYPTAALTGNTNLTGQAKAIFDQNVIQEVQEIQNDINGRSYLKYHPVLSLGLRFGF